MEDSLHELIMACNDVFLGSPLALMVMDSSNFPRVSNDVVNMVRQSLARVLSPG